MARSGQKLSDLLLGESVAEGDEAKRDGNIVTAMELVWRTAFRLKKPALRHVSVDPPRCASPALDIS
ncbi:hypothetical protein E4U59_004693 [Claviceps monticola]|nr:hypothetical protein E4U59_004693 [Claviceps monticola]